MPKKPRARGRRDVDVDDAVAHLEVLHDRRAAIEKQASCVPRYSAGSALPCSSHRAESGATASDSVRLRMGREDKG